MSGHDDEVAVCGDDELAKLGRGNQLILACHGGERDKNRHVGPTLEEMTHFILTGKRSFRCALGVESTSFLS